METLIASIQEKINSGLSFDLELLLDATVEAVNQNKREVAELYHSQGQGFQRFYDGRVNQMKQIVADELKNLKVSTSEDAQRQYRIFKLLLQILESFPTIF